MARQHAEKPRAITSRPRVAALCEDVKGCERTAIAMTDGPCSSAPATAALPNLGKRLHALEELVAAALRAYRLERGLPPRRCRQCERCNYVSYSTRNDECAWYYRCPNLRTIGAGGVATSRGASEIRRRGCRRRRRRPTRRCAATRRWTCRGRPTRILASPRWAPSATAAPTRAPRARRRSTAPTSSGARSAARPTAPSIASSSPRASRRSSCARSAQRGRGSRPSTARR